MTTRTLTNQAQQLQTVVAPRFPKATAYPKGMARGTPFVTGGSGTRSLVGTLAVDDPWMGDPDVPFPKGLEDLIICEAQGLYEWVQGNPMCMAEPSLNC